MHLLQSGVQRLLLLHAIKSFVPVAPFPSLLRRRNCWRHMGGLLSYFVGSDPKLDIPDPATGLTPRERQIVTDTWAIVKQDAKGVGVDLFMGLFEAHPEYQKPFSSFDGLSLSELRVSKKLTAHATSVMYSLTCVIDNLADPECLTELLLKLGENHGRRKLTENEFNDLKVVLMQLLKQKLGSRLTVEGEEAWSKTVDVAYKCIFEGMKKYKTSKGVE